MSASPSEICVITENVLAAQELAERETEDLEREAASTEDVPLPMVPKLLQLPQADLVEKTQEFKAKGNQLDLLLLKAESYSHFIMENQKRSRIRLQVVPKAREDEKSKPPKAKKGGKRKSAGGSSESPTKKARADGVDEVKTDDIGEEFTFRQPQSLVGGTLLPYQLDGLQWLLSLWENGLSGILADEMGLGKTIQIISLIAHLRDCNTPGPYLIAGPLATIPNWINEFKKWLPSCPVIMYHGSKAERDALRKKHMPLSGQKAMTFPVVITSFEILMIDRTSLEKYVWQYLILDEGHRIKNRNCRLVRELKSVKSVTRLLLTGTPIQNTLEELWSLLNFCSPMIFDDLQVFQSWFGFKNIGKDTQVDDIIGDEQSTRVVTKLHEILRPFLLRRIKKDVLVKMPPKREIVVYCGMSSLQREYYLRAQEGTLRDTLMAMGIDGAKDVSQQNTFMNLRKVSNHPFLFGEPRDESGRYLGEAHPKMLVMASGKFKLLEKMLPRLKAGNHKVLIFSQMTELLNILEDYIIVLGYNYCRLDGSTKVFDRQESIDRFNKDPDTFVFLLSTRAGGLGINLTAADTCILFDSDWNPHQDSQAQDRCHRIGQSSPVLVYRLLTAGTVEIEMLEKQISKKKLERLTIHGGDYRRAGHRAGSELTLSKLRKLLEDDVKNLSRMTTPSSTSSSSSAASSNGSREGEEGKGSAPEEGVDEDAQESSEDNGRTSTKKAPGSGGRKIQFLDISDEELDLIMDRSKLFVPVEEEGRAAEEVPALDEDGMATVEAKAAETPAFKMVEVLGGHLKISDVVPLSGAMYDIVTNEQQSSLLQAIN